MSKRYDKFVIIGIKSSLENPDIKLQIETINDNNLGLYFDNIILHVYTHAYRYLYNLSCDISLSDEEIKKCKILANIFNDRSVVYPEILCYEIDKEDIKTVLESIQVAFKIRR